MVGFLLTAAIILLTMCQSGQAWNKNMSSLDTARWLCEHHSHALASKFEVIPDQQNITRKYYCNLYFDYELPEEKWTTVCEYMYPAYLEKTEKTTQIGHFSCRYEILFLCHPGKFPVHHLCVEFSEKMKTLEEAAEDCKQRESRLPTKIEGDVLTQHTLLSINPRLFGYKGQMYWIGSEPPSYLLMVRSWFRTKQGSKFPRTKKTHKSYYICLSTAMKQTAMYEMECNIYKNNFKLTAAFYEGTCYILSPSLSVAPIVRDAPDVRQLHERCRWFSREDRAVNPMSASRRQAIDTVLEWTRYEYTYLMTTAVTTTKKNNQLDDWAVQNHVDLMHGWSDTPIYPGAKMWAEGRPIIQDNVDGQPNIQAVVEPRPIRTGLLLDVPNIFRSHLMCATGITTADFAYTSCDKDWLGITRDEGRVMCVRAFSKELESKTYDEAMQFCRQYEAVLAPMESADEQEIILRQVINLKPGRGSMWLGAKRRQPTGPFYWELDGKQVAEGTGTNWAPDEPNNAENREGCMEIYISGQKQERGTWNDIACDKKGHSHHDRTRIVGGVCAKYLI